MSRIPSHFIALTLIVTIFAGSAFAAPKVLDRLEASVNSSLILLSDVQKFRKTMKLRLQIDPLFRGSALAAKGASASDADIVEFLIDEKIILQKYPVNDSEVEQQINDIQGRNHIDRQQLKSAIASEGFSFDDYFELTRAGWSKKNLIGSDIQTKVTISDDDVKNYYVNHYNKGGGNGPRTYHIQIISVSGSSFKNLEAAKDVALRAQKALKSGESWDEVSKRFSDHPSAQTGGDLGTMTEDQMNASIRGVVKKLQVGQISEIQGGEKSGGYFILRLSDASNSDTAGLDRVKDEIKEQLLASEYQHQIQLWLERQRQAAFIHRAGEAPTVGIPKVNEAKE